MESIKQEIINNIYENGEQLITGPILQEVLLDMVDDVNDKVASASAAIPGDLVEKTGSWDDAADWVEQNSSSVVLQPDLDGYATEQWVEDQGYLKEIPEGYATTESLNDLSESVAQDFSNLDIPDTSGLATTESVNQLSESVAQSIADIPEVDLSGYATTASVNEATESVKEWVEAKHYLTTASLSGSVTEETVGFMINDATASVKDWVESQSYATEQWVEEQGYLKEHQDISGLATTESVTSLSESVAQDFANLNIPDVSGLATTESVSQLSESVASDFANLDIPDISGLATTESVSNLSESVAETIANIPQADLSGYLTTASYTTDSASFDERISAITGSDLSSYATTASLNQLSESVAQDLEGKADKNDLPDFSVYVTTGSLNELSESVAGDIESLTNSLDGISQGVEEVSNSLANYATTESVNQISESFAETIANIPTGSAADLSGYATTASVNSLSESVASDFESLNNAVDGINVQLEEISGSLPNYLTTESANQLSASFDERISAISGSDLSGYATTESVNQLSESIAGDIESLTNSLDGVSQGVEEVSNSLANYATTESVSSLSASFDQRINDITGSDLSGYATTSSVNALSESVSSDSASFDQRINGINIPDVSIYATTASLNSVSESLSASIASITSSGSPVDLSGYATTASLISTTDPSNSAALFLEAIGNIIHWDEYDNVWKADGPIQDGEGSWENAPAILKYFADYGIISYEQEYDEVTGEPSHWYVQWNIGNAEWSENPIMGLLKYISSGSGDGNTLVEWEQLSENDGTWYSPIVRDFYGYEGNPGFSASFVSTSASFDSRINNIITGSGVDLSGYATTESVNNLSSSVGTISSSFAETIANLPTGSEVDLSGYATTASVNTLSASFDSRINSISASGGSGPWEHGTGFGSAQILHSHAKADYSVAEGFDSVASESYSHAEGYDSKALARSSHAEGESTFAGEGGTAGRGAHAEGQETRASGDYSHAEGRKTRARNNGTHAEGYSSNAALAYAHAEGYMTFAEGRASHAEGSGSKGEDPNFFITPLSSDSFTAIPIGEELPNFYPGYTFISNNDIFFVRNVGENNVLYTGTTQSITTQSLAECFNGPAAIGEASHVEGYGTIATNPHEHAQGKFNATASKQIFSVGVGHNKSNRRNAVSILTGSNDSASVYIQGIGGYDGTNPTPGTNDLASVLSRVSGSSYTVETWTFMLEGGTSVTKNIVVA